jgi:hypothetical protein
MGPKVRELFIPRKNQKRAEQPHYGTDMRAIETWGREVGAAIASISTGGGGVPYASLTGPGYTTSPGALTQNGNFTVAGDLTFGQSGSSFLHATGGTLALFQADSTLQITSAGYINVGGGDYHSHWTDTMDLKLQAPAITLLGASSAAHTGSAVQIVTDTTSSYFGQAGGFDITISASSGITIGAGGPGLVMTPSDLEIRGGAGSYILSAIMAGQDFKIAGGVSGSLNTFFAVHEPTTGAPHAQIGFYGATPVNQAGHPVTLADVITLLTNLGLCS